jgi:prolyl 4-hydroxylase
MEQASVEWTEIALARKNEAEAKVEELFEGAFLVHGLLGAEECAHYVAEAERQCFQHVKWQQQGIEPSRDNYRLAIDSLPLAALLWERLSPLLSQLRLPTNFEDFSSTQTTETAYEWVPVAVHDKFRLLKYYRGGYFGAHRDGHVASDKTLFPGGLFLGTDHKTAQNPRRSLYTFMIYLNDGYQGGTTNFLDESSYSFSAGGDIIQLKEGCEKRITHRVQPRTGSALIFFKNYLHEGSLLEEGIKYILRTDLLFEAKSITIRAG